MSKLLSGIGDIIFWTIFGIILGILIDHLLFRVWHYYAHRHDTPPRPFRRKKTHKEKKQKDLEKQLRRRGFDKEISEGK